MIDIVIVSSSKTKHLTDNLINQIHSLTDAKFNIIVVEDTIEDWGYNKALNIGIKKGNGEYVFCVNNDLGLTPNWDKELIKAIKENELDSASPLCPLAVKGFQESDTVFGNETGIHLAGWAIMIKREFWNLIDGFDEDFRFWCCDNSYQQQLIQYKGKHALVRSSIVLHYGSQTLKSLKGTKRYDYTLREIKKYNKKFNTKLF